jgi:DNA-binding MarR family transcriptional regulator
MKSSNSVNELESFSRRVVEIFPLIFREISKRETNPLVRGKISFPQMVALDYVSRKPLVKMTELANVLSVKTSTATVLVDRLVRAKMLERRRDENDRRVVWVRATPKGRRLVSRIMDEKRQSMKRIFSGVTPGERAQYLKVMMKVKNYLLRDLRE